MSTPEDEAQLLAEAQEQARLQEEEIHRQQHWKDMWDKCINISATKKLFTAREVHYNELRLIISRIGKLPQSDITSRILKRFLSYKSEAEKRMETCKLSNELLYSSCFTLVSHDIGSNPYYSNDQETHSANLETIIDVIEDYQELLDGTEGLEMPELEPTQENNDTLLSILKNQQKNQVDQVEITRSILKQQQDSSSQNKVLVAAMEKWSNAATAPKPHLPKFKPNSTFNDYLAYKDWERRWELYIAKLPPSDWPSKVEWLREAVEGQARQLILACQPNQDGYNEALKLLNDKYRDADSIREAYFEYIHSFKIQSLGKNYSDLSKILITFKNYVKELESKHNIIMPPNYLGHVINRTIPKEVKREFKKQCETLYPTSVQIFDKMESVIKSLNADEGVSLLLSGNEKKEKAASNSISTSYPPSKNSRKAKKKQAATVNNSSSSINNVNKTPAKSEFRGTSRKDPCIFCGGKHSFAWCPKCPTYMDKVNGLKIYGKTSCGKCLQKIHQGNCDTSYFPCRKCPNSTYHNNIMCQNKNTSKSTAVVHQLSIANCVNHTPSEENSSPVVPSSQQLSLTYNGKKSRAVALETAMLTALNSECKNLPISDRQIAIMIDSGAQRSVVSSSLVEKLHFPIVHEEKIALQGFNDHSPKSKIYSVVQIQMGREGKKPIVLEALVVKSINAFVLSGAASFAKKVAEHWPLADYRLVSSKSDEIQVDLLVANDNKWKVISPWQPPIQYHGMFLPVTVFGDVLLSGNIPGSDNTRKGHAGTNVVTLLNLVIPPILDNDEQILYSNLADITNIMTDLDNLGITVNNKQDEEIGALDNYNKNVRKDPDTNAYIVGFPWFSDSQPAPGELDSNADIVRSRFNSTMKGLDNKPQVLAEYANVHKKEEEQGFIERVPLHELRDSTIFRHYITHFPVIKDSEGCTTKVRRVYDASLHKRGRPSLNDLMSKGSQLTPHIIKILLILRLTPYLFASDISKAFLRMFLKPEDRNYTCFYARENWLDPNSPISIWRFRSVLFGATSSPFLLNMSIADIIKNNEFDHHMEVFVDNLFVLLTQEQKILEAAENVYEIFKDNAFPLHELISNSPMANEKFKSQGLAPAEPIIKTLGLYWNTGSDTWKVNTPDFTVEKASKRTVLSDLARIFDPLGFYAILTIRGRLVLQEAYEGIWKWDGVLPDPIQQSWSDLTSKLTLALNSPISRWLGTDITSDKTISVHCFTDASDKALGCVLYLVQDKRSKMYASKPKLCPVKFDHYSIPRKELTAISLGVRFLKFILNSIKKYFTPASLHLWSDSTTALNWCITKTLIKELFIRSRVEHIQKFAGDSQLKFHYILSEQNPADYLTKISEVGPHDHQWVYGPEILLNEERWFEFTPIKGRKDIIPIFQGNLITDPLSDLDPSNYQDIEVLYKDSMLRKFNKISNENKVKVKLYWIKRVQSGHFSDIILFLKTLQGNPLRSRAGKQKYRMHKLTPPQLCSKLHLFLDKEGIIRVKTSTTNFPGLSNNQMNPVLLPRESKFVHLLALFCHQSVGHMGLKATTLALRNNFWVPKHTSLIDKVLRSCQICIKQRGKRYHYAGKPTIPEFRADVDHPFRCISLDMTGHFFVKTPQEKKDQKTKKSEPTFTKCYLIIIVCMSTGCGDVEVIDSASSEVFAGALERFFARRGVPELIISDQGSNFKGYYPELKEISDQITATNGLIQHGIRWEWVPIAAPSFNGYAERSLGLIKNIIKRSIGQKILTFDQLRTVAAYAEAVFNSRPLHVLSTSDPDYTPITPNMLVYGRNLRMLCHDLLDIDLKDPKYKPRSEKLSVMALKLRDTLAKVRKIWKSEYFHFLTQKDPKRTKSSPYSKSLILPQVGHYVLIWDDSNDMKIGKIVELVNSDDGEIRQVIVSTANSTGTYPTFNLRYLEGYREDLEAEDTICGPSVKDDNPLDPQGSQADSNSVRIKVPRQAKLRASEKIKRIASRDANLSSLIFRPSTKNPLVSHNENVPM